MGTINIVGTYIGYNSTLKLRHQFVIEDKPRVQNRAINFTGTVRTCGVGGTYTTLTSAYNASASGDIIQLTDNTTITLSSETGGYLLLNTTGKRILIRGNANDITKCIIQQNIANSFGIRMRDCADLVLQDLTITSNQNNPFVSIDGGYTNRNFVYKNCIVDAVLPISFGGTTTTDSKWIEINNCELNCSNLFNLINGINGINDTILISNSIINSSSNSVNVFEKNKGKICCYDNTFNQSASTYIMKFGTDMEVPTDILGLVDVRNNKINYTNSFYGHAILLGRGTDNVYCVNNIINIPLVNNSLAIGIVNKTTSSIKGNSIIKGNYVNAPRPYYIKGAQNTITQNNSFIANIDTWEAFGFVNPVNIDGSKISLGNKITYNNFVGGFFGINVYNGGASEIEDTTIKGCLINNNHYYFTQNYLFKGSTSTQFSFQDRSSYWQNNNEINSNLISKSKLPIKI